MGYQIPETSSTPNLGARSKNTETLPAGLIICKTGLSIDTYANALLKATWDTNTKAAYPNRFLPTGACIRCTPQDKENVTMPSPFKGDQVVFWGKNSMMFEFDISDIAHAEWFKMNDRTDWSAFTFDDNDNIKGVSSDGIKFEPRKCLSLQVLPRSTPAEGEKALTKVVVTFADTDLANRNPAIVNPTTWTPRELEPVHNIDLTISGTWTATGGAFTASFRESGSPVSGLAPADAGTNFAIAGKSITSITESSTVPGLYVLVSTSLVTSTLTMVACASITGPVDKVENTTGMAFTIA